MPAAGSSAFASSPACAVSSTAQVALGAAVSCPVGQSSGTIDSAALRNPACCSSWAVIVVASSPGPSVSRYISSAMLESGASVPSSRTTYLVESFDGSAISEPTV